MEFIESSSPEAEEDPSASSSIPRGGPLFAPNLVFPLTRVPQFESSLLQLLQGLETEVCYGSADSCDDDIDISVDELEVFSDEELVDVALQGDGEAAESSSQLREDQSGARGELRQGVSNGEHSLADNSVSKEDASTIPESTNGSTSRASPDGTGTGDNGKKRKRRNKKGADRKASSSHSQLSENQSNAGGRSRQCISNKEHSPVENPVNKRDASIALECTTESTSEATSSSTSGDNSKKRKLKNKNSQGLAPIRGQPTNKNLMYREAGFRKKAAAAAGLHCLSTICKINEGATSPAERDEKLEIMRTTGSKVKLKPSIIQEHVPVQYPEVVLSFEVYHHTRKYIKTQEFLVLGHQMLTELRDKIYCVKDHIMGKDMQYTPSGYFLIEDTFYNDLRDPSALDYSEPILAWLQLFKEEALRKWECIVNGELQQKEKAVMGEEPMVLLPQFKAVEMQLARFYDLKFQLGAGYLYCHQGGCKHAIVIRDMRLIHPDDVQNRAAYPITTFQQKNRAMKCSVCKIYRATKVTLDDKWAQENPCYFCDNCYFLLHYSKDNTLLYNDFSVFDYHPD